MAKKKKKVSDRTSYNRLRLRYWRLLDAAQTAYWHLDTYGTASGGSPEEMISQRRVFELLRPFCPPIPGRL